MSSQDSSRFAKLYFNLRRAQPVKRLRASISRTAVGAALTAGIAFCVATTGYLQSSKLAWAEEKAPKAQDRRMTTDPLSPTAPSTGSHFAWVDVTRDNFEAVLPIFRRQLEKAAFVSIDTEFTGLAPSFKDESQYSDSEQQYYQKKRTGILQFMVVQVGICLWQFDDEQNLVAYPYNFYVYPRPYRHNRFSILGRMPPDDPVFAMSPSSTEFLVNNSFDFNKLIAEGIPFMNREKEAYYTSIGFGPYSKVPDDVAPFVSAFRDGEIEIRKDEDKHFVSQALADVKKWRESIDKANGSASPPLKLEKLNSYQRRLIYQEVPKAFQDVKVHSQKGSEPDSLFLSYLNEQQQTEVHNAIYNANLQAFGTALGFRRLMKTLFAPYEESPSKPPLIVGHNMLLDLMHFYHKFEADLPEDVREFKRELHRLMPRIVDTKHVATTSYQARFGRSTALDVVYKHVKGNEAFSEPNIVFPFGFGKAMPTSTGFLHMAAFDAFITGFSFAKMMKHLQTTAPETDPRKNEADYIGTYAQAYLNQLHLLWSINRSMKLDSGKAS